MSEFVFTTATTTKGQLFTVIKNLLIAAGWADISSNPAADFSVMTSPGEDGTKSLVFQFRESDVSGNNPISTTNGSAMSYRMVASYTPGAAGAAGTFGRTTAQQAWSPCYVAPYTAVNASLTPTAPVTYRYHVNKNRIIIVMEHTAGIAPGIIYFGLPDVQYASEPLSRGLVYAGPGSSNNGLVNVSDTPGEGTSGTAMVQRTLYSQTIPKNPNVAGFYHMTEYFIGDATEGFRFQLSGLYTLPNQNIVNGDTFVIGEKKYLATVFIAGSGVNYNSFGAYPHVLAYRIQ